MKIFKLILIFQKKKKLFYLNNYKFRKFMLKIFKFKKNKLTLKNFANNFKIKFRKSNKNMYNYIKLIESFLK